MLREGLVGGEEETELGDEGQPTERGGGGKNQPMISSSASVKAVTFFLCINSLTWALLCSAVKRRLEWGCWWTRKWRLRLLITVKRRPQPGLL